VDTTYVDGLLAKRANVIETQRERMESIQREGRLPNAEESTVLARMDTEYEELTDTIEAWSKRAVRENEADKAREIVEHIVRPEVEAKRTAKVTSDVEQWFRGHVAGNEARMSIDIDLAPSANFMQAVRNGMDKNEARAIYTDGGASAGSLTVPVAFYNQLYQYIEEASTIRQIAQVFTSAGGGAWTFPRLVTHGVGTQVIAQGTVIGGTDPVFGTIRLDDYRYAQLVKVSNQAASDTGFDLLGFVAKNIGYAVGRITDTAYVLGGGSSAPNGIITAASVGAKTGGSLIALGGGAATAFTQSIDPLIDLQHSVVEGYADRGVFVMNRLTAGTIRKLRDGGAGTIGSYIWTPTTTFEGVRTLSQAGELLGSPVFTDVNFGTQGSAIKTVAFGDFSAYYIRDVGGFRFERSDERYFDTDEIGFRGVLRTDADLVDSGAIKLLQQLL